MTLRERIQACKNSTAEIIKANPEITNVWYELNDCAYKEMEEISKEVGGNNFNPVRDKMQLQASSDRSTIFAYSKSLKIVTTVEIIETPELETA